MAKTMATCIGRDTNRTKEDHRLGSREAEGVAQTWQVKARAVVDAQERAFASVGPLYGFPVASIEWLADGTLIVCTKDREVFRGTVAR